LRALPNCSYPRRNWPRPPGGAWVNDFSAGLVKALGAIEILGAVGLILPAALDIASVLVPLAAVGLATIMVGAAIVNFRGQESKHALLNLRYLALAAFVAWGRLGPILRVISRDSTSDNAAPRNQIKAWPGPPIYSRALLPLRALAF
jgi:hypothetical protein